MAIEPRCAVLAVFSTLAAVALEVVVVADQWVRIGHSLEGLDEPSFKVEPTAAALGDMLDHQKLDSGPVDAAVVKETSGCQVLLFVRRKWDDLQNSNNQG